MDQVELEIDEVMVVLTSGMAKAEPARAATRMEIEECIMTW